MENLPKYYTILFNAITDAIEAIDAQNFGTAKELLMDAQNSAEAMYLNEEEPAE